MQYDLALACRDARAGIDVPAVPLDAIRASAADGMRRKAGWLTAFLASVSMVAVATAAVLGTHIAFDRPGNMVQISANSMNVTFKNPTVADVDAAARHATFPVTLPAGLPNGTKLHSIISSAGAIVLRYDLPGAWRASHHVVWIVLANPTAVSSGSTERIRFELASAGKPIHWRIHGEDVIIAMHNAMTQAELAHLQAAMRVAATATR